MLSLQTALIVVWPMPSVLIPGATVAVWSLSIVADRAQEVAIVTFSWSEELSSAWVAGLVSSTVANPNKITPPRSS